jgi:hypothetical protein
MSACICDDCGIDTTPGGPKTETWGQWGGLIPAEDSKPFTTSMLDEAI